MRLFCLVCQSTTEIQYNQRTLLTQGLDWVDPVSATGSTSNLKMVTELDSFKNL